MPADTDLPDTLVLGLTSQHLVLAAPGMAGIFLGALLGALGILPVPAVAVGVLVVGAATAGVVACNPDGLTYDRFLRARRRHRRAPAVEVAADVLAALPAWTGAGGIQAAPLGLPWDGLDGGGVVALGRDESRAELGFAAVLRLAALDQEALDREAVAKVVACLGVWLSALDCDAQVLVRSRPLELSVRIAELEAAAVREPVPVLAEIAAARAEALRGVAATAPKCLTAYVVLRRDGRPGLVDRVRRLMDTLSAAGVGAEAVPAGELAEMLGGRALGTGDALWPAPDEIERVGDAGLRVGTRCCATYRAAAYPSQVRPGWLTQVLRSGAELDLAVHIAPEDRGAASMPCAGNSGACPPPRPSRPKAATWRTPASRAQLPMPPGCTVPSATTRRRPSGPGSTSRSGATTSRWSPPRARTSRWRPRASCSTCGR